MREISVFRIDDRLIHGQIITVWINYAEAKTIVVADDKTAADEFAQSLLKMATPSAIELKIFSVEEAVTFLKMDKGKGKVLLLVRDPAAALRMVKEGVICEKINVGNLNMKKGKSKVLGNLWVFQEDVEAVGKLYEAGVQLEVRAVPTEHSQDLLELLKKNKLV